MKEQHLNQGLHQTAKSAAALTGKLIAAAGEPSRYV
jgi:hypothetical protein